MSQGQNQNQNGQQKPNAVQKTTEAVQKGKKIADNVKKAKKIANAAKTLSASGPLMYVLFWVFVVIVAIIIITGIVMFLVTMPGMVMEKLKDLDEVAYVRFASVYRQFKDVNTFMDELKALLKEV